MIDEEVKNFKEIYQRIKKENPCIFCLRSAGGCQFKGNKCDSTSLKMYYERNHLEIESILKDIYIKELEKESEQLKAQIEKKEKVIWHDLRKNPKDLPPKDVGSFSTFVITNKGFGYNVDCQNKWFVYWNVTGSYECSTEVVAWCELPKFEVEE
jgi:hypothetical protein